MGDHKSIAGLGQCATLMCAFCTKANGKMLQIDTCPHKTDKCKIIDIHSLVTKMVFPSIVTCDIDDVKKYHDPLRDNCKSITFALNDRGVEQRCSMENCVKSVELSLRQYRGKQPVTTIPSGSRAQESSKRATSVFR